MGPSLNCFISFTAFAKQEANVILICFSTRVSHSLIFGNSVVEISSVKMTSSPSLDDIPEKKSFKLKNSIHGKSNSKKKTYQ